MPKINSAGQPSYDGHQGTVTNAVGEQFELDSTHDADGNPTEGRVVEPIGEGPEERDVVSGEIRPIDQDADDARPVDEPKQQDEDVNRRDDASSLYLGDQKQQDGKAVPAKKSVPAPAPKK